MIRGISHERLIGNFIEDINAYEYGKEYGVYEVIDGHLWSNYEGFFTDEEVDAIVELLEGLY